MDLRLVAISKAVKDKALKEARQGLAVGTHPVDFSVHVTGSIKVGEDGTSDVKESVDWKAAFSTVLGMFREHIVRSGDSMPDDYMADLIGMIFRQQATASMFADTVAAVIEQEEKRHTRVTDTKPKNGTVTTKLNYQFVASPDAIEESKKEAHRALQTA